MSRRPVRKEVARFDNMVTCDGGGRLFRVYEPAWWQVWRWFRLLVFRVRWSPWSRPVGWIELSLADGKSFGLLTSVAYRVRVVGEPKLRNPRVPGF